MLSLVGDQAGFADFAQFVQEEESCVDGGQPRRHGAFEVYRKPVSSKITFLVYAHYSHCSQYIISLLSHYAEIEIKMCCNCACIEIWESSNSGLMCDLLCYSC